MIRTPWAIGMCNKPVDNTGKGQGPLMYQISNLHTWMYIITYLCITTHTHHTQMHCHTHTPPPTHTLPMINYPVLKSFSPPLSSLPPPQHNSLDSTSLAPESPTSSKFASMKYLRNLTVTVPI